MRYKTHKIVQFKHEYSRACYKTKNGNSRGNVQKLRGYLERKTVENLYEIASTQMHLHESAPRKVSAYGPRN